MGRTGQAACPLAHVSKACKSYPYLFVFPLYCFLKVRNLPDIARLLLLQLSDFLRRATGEKADRGLSRETPRAPRTPRHSLGSPQHPSVGEAVSCFS